MMFHQLYLLKQHQNTTKGTLGGISENILKGLECAEQRVLFSTPHHAVGCLAGRASQDRGTQKMGSSRELTPKTTQNPN